MATTLAAILVQRLKGTFFINLPAQTCHVLQMSQPGIGDLVELTNTADGIPAAGARLHGAQVSYDWL
jgi:hypothetical protein